MTRIDLAASTIDWFNNFLIYMDIQNGHWSYDKVVNELQAEWGAELSMDPYCVTFERGEDATLFLLRFS
jgi:hypothetical protein